MIALLILTAVHSLASPGVMKEAVLGLKSHPVGETVTAHGGQQRVACTGHWGRFQQGRPTQPEGPHQGWLPRAHEA